MSPSFPFGPFFQFQWLATESRLRRQLPNERNRWLGPEKTREIETKQKGTNLLNHYDVKISHKSEKVVTEITDVMLGGINRYLIPDPIKLFVSYPT